MSTHHDLAKLADTQGVGRVYFDQCVFGASSSKTTNKQNFCRSSSLDSHKSFAHTHQARTVLSSERSQMANPTAPEPHSRIQMK
eukprot:3861556-Pleurochrysis_carterae.AAC.1